jgi:hypothetical protein
MAPDLQELPEASDGAGNYDRNNAYYRSGRANWACEAEEHFQKFQFIDKVLEMQEGICINFFYA